MRDLRTFIKIIKQVYFILNRKQKVQMVGMFVVILIGSMFELLGVTAMLPFIQSILQPEQLMEKPYIRFFCDLFHITDAGSVIALVGAGIILIYFVKNAYLAFSAYLQAVYCNYTQKDLAVLMLHSYMDRPYGFFVDHGTGVIMQGVNADTNGVYQVITNGFKLLSEVLVVISIAAYLISTDWVLACGVLIVGLLCLLLVVLGLKRKISAMSRLSRSAGANKYRWLNQASGGIKDILVYGRQKYFLNRYETASQDACRASVHFAFASALPERIIEAFCVSGIIITVLLRLKMGVDVESFIPQMAVFAMGAFRLLPSIARTTGYINNFVFYRQYVEATYDNIVAAQNFQKELKDLADDLKKEDAAAADKYDFLSSIELKGIQWKYPEGKNRVLDDLSLEIRKGEAIGIIGESGSGKSTLADILLRLYQPQSGEILMDGSNINAIPKVWSRVIGYVPQAVFLMDNTIRENVTFGAEVPDDEKIWAALKKASLDKFVRELPDGLDTIVGERGVKFSGGQRQRIAIARALYANPHILILDEATSALDNETEEAVMEAIEALAGSMTLIIIAHRVTTLKNCDKIFEIVGGRAVERNKEEVISV
ncbi:MAG: ABC transporter ATP-binding protein [Lachnospiraceae bacterium]|nr:ABC transporter ATP-binding protein [Lachnospiraceae bacterium]